MRVGLEVGINQILIKNLPRMPMQLDQVGPLDLAQISPCAALVNAEQRLERVERVAMGKSFPTWDRLQASSTASAFPERNSKSSACRQALV